MSAAAYDFDHPFSSVSATLLRRFALCTNAFVETGSNVGHGVQAALDAGFEEVHSVELVDRLYRACTARFHGDPRVYLHHGDSPQCLRTILDLLEDLRATIYLDAHSAERNPLLDELEVLRSARRRDHVLLIDDVRMFGTPDWHGLRRSDADWMLREINPRYRFSYADTPNAPQDLLIAEVP